MKLWRVSHQGTHLEPVGIYGMLVNLGLVGIIRWVEYHRIRRAFKGHGTVSRVNGSIVINITEA